MFINRKAAFVKPSSFIIDKNTLLIIVLKIFKWSATHTHTHTLLTLLLVPKLAVLPMIFSFRIDYVAFKYLCSQTFPLKYFQLEIHYWFQFYLVRTSEVILFGKIGDSG